MTGTVVVGPYPTMPGSEAEETLALVRRLVGEGHRVTTVSPVPSAAHHHADLGGARGAATLMRLAAGAERLIVRLDLAALRADRDEPRLQPARLALTAALARARRVDLVLDRVPATVAPRFARLVLQRAQDISVDGEDAALALDAAGIPRTKVTVRPAPVDRRRPDRAQRSAGAPPLPGGPHGLQAAIRARADDARSTRERVRHDTAARPVRQLGPYTPPVPRSPKPGVAALKRGVHRLTGWQIDPLIDHINRLEHAVIEAVESLDQERPNPGG